jgi:hypothetical protein
MRRFTRRIGLFGGPGAVVKAAGGVRRRTREAKPASPPDPVPTPGEAPSPSSEVGKKSWLSWLRGEKPKSGG